MKEKASSRYNVLGNPATEPAGHKARQYRAALAAEQPGLTSNSDLFGPTRSYQLPPPPSKSRGKSETGL